MKTLLNRVVQLSAKSSVIASRINRILMRWFYSLRSLLIIAIGEWKRLVLTPSFILLAVIPPFVVLLYPSTQELIFDKIQNWQTEQDHRSLRSAREVRTFSNDSNDIHNENQAIKFAVLDQSAWVHQRIQDKLLKTDLQVFLDALYNMDESEFTAWARTAIDDLNEDHPVADHSFFLTNLIEFHRALVDKERIQKKTVQLAERLENDENPNSAQSPTDCVLMLWKNIPGRIVEVAPLVSFASFKEVDLEVRSTNHVRTMLHTGKIAGYVIVPHGVSGDSDGLQLIILQSAPNALINDLKNFFQPLLSAVIREKEILETGSPLENVLSRTTVQWKVLPLRDFKNDISRTHNEWWGSPAKVVAFVIAHLPVLVSFIVLASVMIGVPMFTVNTIEERSSKLAETLLASVDAKLLLDAKVWSSILGIVTVLGCWLLFRVAYLLITTPELPLEILPNLQTIHLLHLTFFLISALAFHGYIVMALGSVCNNQIDLVFIILPVLFSLCLAGFVVFELFENPSDLPASVLSFFPPFTPFIMIGRTSNLPPWPIYLTISGLLFVSVVGVRQLGSVFFSRAFLIEKKPQRIKDVARIIREPQ